MPSNSRTWSAPIGAHDRHPYGRSGGEHFEEHTVDGAEHAFGELVGAGGRHHPRGWKIDTDDSNFAALQFPQEALPIAFR